MPKKKEKQMTTKDNALATLDSVPTGNEAFGVEDLVIPQAKLLQPQSPEVTQNGAKAGVVINSITKEELNKRFIPLFGYKEFSEMSEEDRDGKKRVLRTTQDPEAEWVVGRTEWANNEPPAVQKSINFVVVFEDDLKTPVLVKFSKTSYFTGRLLVSLCAMNPKKHYFTKMYHLGTSRKVKGANTWYTYDVKADEYVDDKHIEELAQVAKLYSSLKAKIKTEEAPAETEETPF